MTPPTPDTVFEDDWLTLREPADHASRACAPTRAAARWLEARSPDVCRIVDLGSGTGSNLRYLAPRLGGRQHWTLIDHDAGLLERAAQRCRARSDRDGRRVHIRTRVADLADGLTAQLGDADLVTAAALLDLVTATWVERLAAACAARGAAVLFALSIDGAVVFEPNRRDRLDADDAFVLAQVAAHQQRDKGFGPALGPRAPAVAESALRKAGYRLCSASSAWTLDTSSQALVRTLISGWRDAAREQAPAAGARIDAWAERREYDVCSGGVRLLVGHRDVFAVPVEGRHR